MRSSVGHCRHTAAMGGQVGGSGQPAARLYSVHVHVPRVLARSRIVIVMEIPSHNSGSVISLQENRRKNIQHVCISRGTRTFMIPVSFFSNYLNLTSHIAIV